MEKRQFIRQLTLGSGGYFFASKIDESYSINRYRTIDKHTRESIFYTETPRGAKCLLCPNECELKLNEEGLCRNRVNINNKIYTTAYGNPCSAHIDPIEKKPLFHFYPGSEAYSIGTAGCTLACMNCQNWEISQKSTNQVPNIDLMPEKLVKLCISNSCKSIAYTYNEPFSFYEYMHDTALLAKSNGIKNVLVSNGFINPLPLQKICNVIDAANIDLKSFSDEIYIKLCAGRVQPVLNTLKTLKDQGVWLEITNLIIPTYTDQMDTINRMCDWLVKNGFEDTPLHFSRFFPAYKLKEVTPTPRETLLMARELAIKNGIRHVYIGNVAGTTADNTFCPKCKKILVERDGFMVTTNKITNGMCNFCKQKITGVW